MSKAILLKAKTVWDSVDSQLDIASKHADPLGSDADTYAENWRVQCLTSASEMRLFSDSWAELEKNSSDPLSSFQSLGWCMSWAKTYCVGRDAPEPRILMVFEGNSLMAVLPLMITSCHGIKTLTLFGEPHTQVANVLQRDGFDQNGILLDCIKKCAAEDQVDILALGPVPESSALSAMLEPEHLSPDPAEYLSLVNWDKSSSQSDYLMGLSKNRRKDFGKKLRRLEQMGEVTFTRTYFGEAGFGALIENALAWKRAWLIKTSTVSIGLQKDNVAQFLSDISGIEHGFNAEVEALRLNGKAIAITVNIVGKGMRTCYLTAYDEAFSQISPGTLIHQHAIQASISDCQKSYNFLGFPTHFKRMWATDQINLVRYQRTYTLKGWLWITLWTNNLRPFAKRLLNSMHSISSVPFVGTYFDKMVDLLFKRTNRS